MDSSMEIPSTQVLDDFLPDDSPQSSPEKKKQVGTLRIQGSCYPIFTGENRIGRDPKRCSIVLDGKALSAEHSIIEAHTIDSVFISDLESTNKTRLGKMILKPQLRYQLQDNAQLYFADILATYHQLAKHNTSVESMDSSKEGDLFIPETPSDNMFKKPGDRLCILESPSDDSIIECSQPAREERSQPSNGVRKHIIFGEVKDETALESICEAATQLEFEEVKPESDICEAPTQCFEAIDICNAPTQCIDIVESDSSGKLKKEASKSGAVNAQCLDTAVAGGCKNVGEREDKQMTLTEEKSDSDTDPEEVFGGHGEKKSDSDADTSMTDIFNAPTQLVEGEYGDQNKKEEQTSHETVNPISKACLPQNNNEQLDISSTEYNVVKPKVADSPKKFDDFDELFDAPTQKINHTDAQEEDDGKHKTVNSITDPEQAPTQIISNESVQFDFVKPESRKRTEAEKVTENTLSADCNQNGELPAIVKNKAELEHSVAQSGKNELDTKNVEENYEDDLFDAPTQLINEDYLLGENQMRPSKKTENVDSDTKTLKDDEASTKPDYDKVKMQVCCSNLADSSTNQKYNFKFVKPVDPTNEEMKASAEPDGINDLFDAPTQLIDDSCLLSNIKKKQICPLEKVENVDPDMKTSDDAACAKLNFETNGKPVAEICISDESAPKQKDNFELGKSVDCVKEELKAPAETDTKCDLFDAPTQLIDDRCLLAGKQISPSEKRENVDSVIGNSDENTLRDDATFSKLDIKMKDNAMTEFSISDKNAPTQEENVEFAKPVDSMSEEIKVEPDSDSDLYDAPKQILRSEPQRNFNTSPVINEDGDTDISDVQTQILPSGLGLSKAKGDSSVENASTSEKVDNEDGDTDISDVQTQILPSGLGLSKAKGDSSVENASTSEKVDNEDSDTDNSDVQTQILPSGLGLIKVKDDSSVENASTSEKIGNEDGCTDISDVQTQILPSGLGLSKAKDDSSVQNASTSEKVDKEDGDTDISDVQTQILPSGLGRSKVKDDSSVENASTSEKVDKEDGDTDISDVQTQILPSGLGRSKAKDDSSVENASTSEQVDKEDGDTDISDVQTQILPSGLGRSKVKDDSSVENASTSEQVDKEDGDTDILDVQTQILPSGLGRSKAKDDSSVENASTSEKVDKEDGDTDISDVQTQILPSGLGRSTVNDNSSVENASTSEKTGNEECDTGVLDVQTQMLPSEWGHSKAIGNGASEKDGETTKSLGDELNNSEDIESIPVLPSEIGPCKAKENDEVPSQLIKTTMSVRGEVVDDDDDLCEAPSQTIERNESKTSRVASGIPAKPGKDDSDKLLRKGSGIEPEKLNENAECEESDMKDIDKPAANGDDVEIPSRMKGDFNENLHSTDICIDIFHEQKKAAPLKKSQARVYTNRAKQRNEDEDEEPDSGDDTGTSSPVLKQNHVRKRSNNVPSPPEEESDLQEGIASPVIQKHSHLKRKGLATYSNRNKRLKVESDSTLPQISSLLGSERTKPARTESRIPVLTNPSPEGRRKKRETEASPHSTPRKTRTHNSRSKNMKEDRNSSKQSNVTRRSPKVKDSERSEEKLVKGQQKPVTSKRGVSLKKDENKSKVDTTKVPETRRSSRRNEIKMDEPKLKEEPVERKNMPSDTVKHKNKDLSPSKSRLKVESKTLSRQESNVKDSTSDGDMSPRKSRLKAESKMPSRQASNMKDSASDGDMSPRKSRLKAESKMPSRQASSMKDSASDGDMSPRKSRLKAESKMPSRQASSMKDSASDGDMSPRKSRLKAESKMPSRQASSMKDSASDGDMSPSKSRLKAESKTSPRSASSMKDSTRDSGQQSSTRASSMKDSGQQLPRTTRTRASGPPAKQEPENKYEDSSDSGTSHSTARRTSNRRAKHVEEVNTDFVYTSTSRNNSPNLSKKHKREDTESESSQSEPPRSQSKTTPTKRPVSRSNKRKLSESEVMAFPKRIRGSSRLNESVTSGVEGSPTRARGRGNNTYKVLFTGVTCTKEDEEFVKKLGGSVVDTPDNCTVLVTDKVRRTYKFLCIMGMGKPVVSLEWLKRSRQSGSFLDPWHYIVKDSESEMKFNFSLHDSLKVASQHQLLTGYSVMVTSSVKPPPQEMKGIITSSGGKILTRNPGNNWPEKSFTISCPDDKAQWSKVKKGGRPIVGAEVLLLGVLQQKLDLKTHALVV
ncbi:mediator of DNA damage checkpoint protein 1-like [Anabrus simplex]|uniref:mediator of DNA damage checkpoint protein 1-like n=1 Tax=Anabrus simplex TaxID=316456 RepID=UPI0035A2B20F